MRIIRFILNWCKGKVYYKKDTVGSVFRKAYKRPLIRPKVK